MELFTIGFTKKTAEQFFDSLRRVGVERLIDIRRNNSSQLAGFTKREDLAYFLRELCAAAYVHEPLLAPTQELLDRYRNHQVTWREYELEFLRLIQQRRIENRFDRESFAARSVLLCSEPTAARCHRRLVANYLAHHWGDLAVTHL